MMATPSLASNSYFLRSSSSRALTLARNSLASPSIILTFPKVLSGVAGCWTTRYIFMQPMASTIPANGKKTPAFFIRPPGAPGIDDMADYSKTRGLRDFFVVRIGTRATVRVSREAEP